MLLMRHSSTNIQHTSHTVRRCVHTSNCRVLIVIRCFQREMEQGKSKLSSALHALWRNPTVLESEVCTHLEPPLTAHLAATAVYRRFLWTKMFLLIHLNKLCRAPLSAP